MSNGSGSMSYGSMGNGHGSMDNGSGSMSNGHGSMSHGHAAAAERIAVFTAGRFQPPTPGHLALLAKVVEVAGEKGGDAFVFPSYSVKGYTGNNIQKNPISYKSKILYLEQMINNSPLKGRIHLVNQEECSEKPCNTAFAAASFLKANGYTKLFLVLGSARAVQPQFHKILNTTVISIARNESKGGVIGMSGTKIRKAAMNNNMNTIRNTYKGLLTNKEQNTLVSNIKRGLTKGGRRSTRRMQHKRRKTQKHSKA